MTQALSYLLHLKTTPLPLILIGAGMLAILLSVRDELQWRLSWSRSRFNRILIAGLISVLSGGVLFFAPDTQEVAQIRGALAKVQASLATPTPTPVPFVVILDPAESIQCPPRDQECRFAVQGLAGGVPSVWSYRIYTFVYSVDPLGPGYFLQPQPARIQVDGSWIQYPSAGNVLPSQPGPVRTIQVAAVLVRAGASFNGSALESLPSSFYLASIRDIDGVIAVSDTITLSLTGPLSSQWPAGRSILNMRQ